VNKVLTFDSTGNTHQGNVRQLNEDSILSCPSIGLWTVADGMGGHSAGEVASQLIVSELSKLAEHEPGFDLVDSVEDALLDINAQLKAHSNEKLNGLTIGSTVVSLVAYQNVGVVLWVGDSRLYLLRQGKLTQLTKDHSEVQAQIDSGLLTAEQAESSAIRNVLSRAVGAFDNLQVDVNAMSLQENDMLLLCSDGLYNELSEDEMIDSMSLASLEQVSAELMARCLNSEAKDNVSFILVKALYER